MAEKDLHLTQARHNKKAAKHLLENNCTFPDWVVTCAFYSALHCFEAHLYERKNDHSESLARQSSISPHVFRKEFIHKNHRVIFRDWTDLFHECSIARYLVDLSKPAYKYFSKNDAEKLIYKLDKIRHHFGYRF